MKQVKLQIYKMKVGCQNCREEITVIEIPKGQTVDAFCQTKDCPNCGCKIYRGTNDWYWDGIRNCGTMSTST